MHGVTVLLDGRAKVKPGFEAPSSVSRARTQVEESEWTALPPGWEARTMSARG